VTFLFTDVEGSTRRWEADADAMRAALADHDVVLRAAIEAHGGLLFKHTGDGVCAAFSSPKSAVDAAIVAQRRLQLPVRMGLATGEAELRDGDYFGAVLNRAARVMAAGHGGQILLVESTAGLLSGVDLADLGPRRLRDLPTPVGVFQVRAEGLATEFPPLRALDTTRGNLRPATTSFIGRESELAEIATAVRSHRLVTLTGVGGVGKTRLALEVAARLAGEFPDGAWVFELAAVTDPAAVPDAVAAVLGIIQQPGKTVSESVAAALEGRVRLLVIDNCEHVLDAAADLVDAILAESATVKILATSREGLGVGEEQVRRVLSLDVKSGMESAAANLFVERAHSVASDFSPTHPGEADAVVEICRRLDGIPLAIELAASRMASMSSREVRDRLDQRFRLLVGSRRGLARHQTLRQAVAWSYDLLDDAERALLDRCSVFAGGFDLQSACAVAGFDSTDDYGVLDMLDSLVRKSLLVADRSSGQTRFSMLETIRQFAEEELADRGEASAVRTAHSRYFAGRETAVFALWDSPRQREAYAWLAAELANLRIAFRSAADEDDLDTAATIATVAAMLGYLAESYEPIAWAEELIEPARAADHPKLAALYTMASNCYTAGRVEAAVRYTEDGSKVVLDRSHDVLPYGQESNIGGAYMYIGHPERWVEISRAELRRRPGTAVSVRTCLVLGLVFAGSGEEARVVADGMVEAAEATRNPFMLSFALFADGVAFGETDPGRALDAYRRGLLIAQDSGNRFIESTIAYSLGRLEATRGDPASAFDYLGLAIGNLHDAGDRATMCIPLALLATALDRLERYDAAATIAGFACGALTEMLYPEITAAVAHLRDVLGDPTYESRAEKGATMTAAAMATYAYDQIDRARAELSAVAK
jgi:predicted ATPase